MLDSLVYCCSPLTWPFPDIAEGSCCPPSVNAELSVASSPSVRSSKDPSGAPPGESCSEELSSPSLSGDRGRQWSGMFSSDSAVRVAGNGLWYSGFCSSTGRSRPGKQITARYQCALRKQKQSFRHSAFQWLHRTKAFHENQPSRDPDTHDSLIGTKIKSFWNRSTCRVHVFTLLCFLFWILGNQNRSGLGVKLSDNYL